MIMGLAALEPGMRALDLGCGTGVNTPMALLEEAWQAADPDQPTKQLWMYFITRPTQ